MKAFDVGYAKQKQYENQHRRRHAVKRNEEERWVLECNGKPATREYKGFRAALTCTECLKIKSGDEFK